MKKKGFTLVELLAVIAILGVLVVVVMVNVLKIYREAKEDLPKIMYEQREENNVGDLYDSTYKEEY